MIRLARLPDMLKWHSQSDKCGSCCLS